MIRFAIIVIVLIGFIGCQPEERIYSEHKELSPELRWLKADTKEFKVPVNDTETAYNLGMSFRFVNGYQYDGLKVSVTETSPSGKETVNEYTLKVRNENGEYIGEAGYDIWDSEHVIVPNKRYEESGTYTYTIAPNMPHDPVLNVMEIGVILDLKK